MVPRKRGKQGSAASAAKKAKEAHTEPSPEAKLRRLEKLIKEVELFGARPAEPASLFMIQGANAYTLHQENLVSLAKTTDPELADKCRSAAFRRRLTINAGTPTSKNQAAGQCFQGTDFRPTECETHEKRWFEPKPLNFELAPQPYCSEADVLARYVGWKALMGKGGAHHFVIFFLHQGLVNAAKAPEEGDDPCTFEQFHKQREHVEAQLRKLMLVYPKRVHPVLSNTGEAIPVGQQVPDEYGVPYAVACFASILSDKRDGKPGATLGTSIGGYHEKCRLWPLSTKVLQKIGVLMEHYGIDIPQLTSPLAGTLQLEQYRNDALDAVGPPPTQLTTELGLKPEWLARYASAPFAKPWVQKCSFRHPNGEVDEATGKPVLVPLYRGCAEERNGHCWLDPDALEPGLAHSERVQQLLCILVGTLWKPPASHTEARVRELQASLQAARDDNWALKTRCSELESELGRTRNELKKALQA